jgi:hypothetical protein
MHLPKCDGSAVHRALWPCFPEPKQGYALPAPQSARAAALAGRDVLDFRRDLLLFAFAQQVFQSFFRESRLTKKNDAHVSPFS